MGSNRIEWRYWYGGICIEHFRNRFKKYHGHQMGISLSIFQIIHILLIFYYLQVQILTQIPVNVYSALNELF